MKRARNEPAPPYGRHVYELVHAGPEGVYWRAANGVEVRVAAAERERNTKGRHLTPRFVPAVRALFGAVFAR